VCSKTDICQLNLLHETKKIKKWKKGKNGYAQNVLVTVRGVVPKKKKKKAMYGRKDLWKRKVLSIKPTVSHSLLQ